MHPRLLLVALFIISSPAFAQLYFGKAVAVDGDTLEMTGVRFVLAGVDAVEARQTCKRADAEWNCGEYATAALQSLVEGKNVSCKQAGTDAYGRVIARCEADGRDLGQEMVRMGYALHIPEEGPAYAEWEDFARGKAVGIWSGEFMQPSEFRVSDRQTSDELAATLAARKRRLEALPASRQATAGIYYRGCREVRAAGKAPLYRGEPGYRPEMDGDGDGVACELYGPRRR